MTSTRTITLAPGHLGIETGATYTSIAYVNPHAYAEPLPDPCGGGRGPLEGGGGPPRGGGCPPGGGAEPLGGGGGSPAGGPPRGSLAPIGFNLQAPAAAGDTKLVGQAPTTYTG